MGPQEIQIVRDHRERPTLAGAASFTGMAILERLHARGWKPIGLTSASLNEATGLKKWRLERLKSKGIDVVSGIRAEDGSMAQWVRNHRPKYWIHHFHHMEAFRSPEYDVKKSLEVGLDPLELLVRQLAEGGCRGVIHSGSYFEPGEGSQSISAKVTPYAETKRQIWLTLKELVDRSRIPLAKVVIPNPIGAGENLDRLIPLMIKKAVAGGELELKTPHGTADNLPVTLLAEVYEMAIQDFASAGEEASLLPVFYRPSVGAMTQVEFAQMINRDLVQKCLGLAEVKISLVAQDSTPAFPYSNASELRMRVQWEQFWKDYAAQLKQGGLLNLIIGN